MKNLKLLTSAVVLAFASSAWGTTPIRVANEADRAVANVFSSFLPGTTQLGFLKINKVTIDDKSRTITVDCNEGMENMPFSARTLPQLKDGIRNALGAKYAKYKVNIFAIDYDKNGKEVGRHSFDELALFAKRTGKKPVKSHGHAVVTDLGAEAAPLGFDGANIAMWQSHGWYFEPKLNRWEWQRARIFQTVEDLYTQSYVMPYLMPMLRNAGAYVMSPRERDTNTIELIVDNDGKNAVGEYIETGTWSDTPTPGFAYVDKILKKGDNPFQAGTARQAKASKKADKAAKASWNADFPETGTYAVYVSYESLPNSASDAVYTVNSKSGARQFKVNQKMGGGTWMYLGHFDFDKGTPSKPVVELSAVSKDGNAVITADAVKIGGGMGNVARIVEKPLDSIDYQYVTSNYPRFVEGARYFMQWAGAPDSVYTMTNNVNDYSDGYAGRGYWVNWLAGGSDKLPDREGLNIPVDLSFAFHTDAGTTMNDSIVGTLGIYCTDGRKLGDKLPDGTSRLDSRDLTDLVMTNIVDDVRRAYEPKWTRRGMWDRSYAEARTPQVPAMLLEFLSHQNFADMKYGLDPEFRFTVSRAIYKGMLEFLAHRDGRSYMVTPLAPHKFAITNPAKNQYSLSWEATADTLTPSAVTQYYIVEERVNDGGFRQIAKVTSPSYQVTVSDGDIHSYRIIAGNEGGVSFPTEVLALCNKPDAPATVNVINGFTRISAPDWFDSGEIAGFYDVRDPGVPDKQDINYIGAMFEYRRNIPWMDDDAAGFGASRSNYEDKVIAGNTFDFVYEHGKAIAEAGYSFISSSVEAYMAAPLQNEPQIVDLILGKQKEIKKGRGVYGTRYKTFPSALQNKIAAHTANGGDIFVSGAFVATDLWDNPNSSEEVAKADQKFATEVLGYHWRVGQASTEGQAYQVPTRFKQFTGGDYDFFNIMNSDCYAVESPDSFYAPDSKKGCTLLRYTENNLVAGTAYVPGNYKTVVIGFPFETIKGQKERTSLMSQILNFFSK